MRAKRLDPGEIEVTHLKGSGPGGQNRNKRLTGIRMRHLPTGVVVMATERRSQSQNLSLAFTRMEKKLERLYHRPLPRTRTRPTRSSRERRIQTKRHGSQIKRLRGKIQDPTDG